MEFSPGIRPDFSTATPEDVAQWVEEQFIFLAEILQGAQESVALRGIARPPEKYGEGTLCNFLPDAEESLSGNWLGPGFYVWRAALGRWVRLEEKENA